jgi:hypothetical protein
MIARALPLLLLLAPLAGCGGGDEGSTGAGGAGGGGTSTGAGAAPAKIGCDPHAPATTTASCVLFFHPGPGAGFGQDRFPEIVFGPPHGAGKKAGSTDVLSLGTDGEIALGFGAGAIDDGEGDDFIVFENAFYAGGNPAYPFQELGEVSVSTDGETWTAFPCTRSPWIGCAGRHPVESNPKNGISAFDPAVAGGDAFDLAAIGVTSARFVRIQDRHGTRGADGTTGFDLDAIAVVHPAP